MNGTISIVAKEPLAAGSNVPQLVPTKSAPLSFTFPVAQLSSYLLDIEAMVDADPSPLAALVSFSFFDESGNSVKAADHGLLRSRNFAAYLYLPMESVGERIQKRLRVPTPRRAARLAVEIRPWRSPGVRLLREPTLHQIVEAGRTVAVPIALSGKSEGLRDRIVPLLQKHLQRIPGGVRLVRWLGLKTPAVARPPLWDCQFDCESEETYRLDCVVGFSGKFVPKEALVAVAFWDRDGRLIDRAVPGLAKSATYGWYRYIERTGNDNTRVQMFVRAPMGAVRGRAQFFPLSGSVSVVSEQAPKINAARWPDFRGDIETNRLDVMGLRSLLDLSVSEGDIDSTIELVGLLQGRDKGQDYSRRLKLLRGTRQELRSDWLPRIWGAMRPQSASPERWHPAHILKAMVPQEASGGAVRSWSIVRHQAKMGWKPTALLPATAILPAADFDDAAAQQDGLRSVQKEGVLTVYPKYLGLDRSFYRPDHVLELETTLYARFLADSQCNIVHAASGFKGFDNALKGITLADWLSVPLVYEIRSFHEHTWAASRKDVELAPLAQLRARQELRCIRASDAIVTISDAMVDELVRRGADPASVFMVPNAVDESFFEASDERSVAELREQLGLNNCLVAGYISNMSHREGHDVLVRALHQLAVAFPNLRCLFVGAGQREVALRQLVQQLGIANRVHFVGEVPHDRIRDYYALIDIFVVPRLSDYASDFVTPLKPFEALALGRTLVMSDRPVAREILGDNERGLSFQTGEFGDLSRALRTLIENPQRARALAEAGRAWVRNERTWDRTIKRYERVYEYASNTFESRAVPHRQR